MGSQRPLYTDTSFGVPFVGNSKGSPFIGSNLWCSTPTTLTTGSPLVGSLIVVLLWEIPGDTHITYWNPPGLAPPRWLLVGNSKVSSPHSRVVFRPRPPPPPAGVSTQGARNHSRQPAAPSLSLPPTPPAGNPGCPSDWNATSEAAPRPFFFCFPLFDLI